MSDYQFILTEVINHVGVITLNRPQQMNAINQVVSQEIVSALRTFDNDDKIGCIIITGNDKCFAAGADLKQIANIDFAEAYRSDFAGIVNKMTDIRKPIIAAVSGIAFGAGTEIALMCDMIIATENAQFALPEVTLGVIPGAGGPARLARAVGKAKAMYYILTGKPFTAQEAEAMGITTMTVANGSHVEEAIKVATAIANNPRLAVLAGKEAVNQQSETPLISGLKHERGLFYSLFGTADQREGMTAFAEKRKPKFQQY
ncbi:enoyl-CoA hydratase-related protein [Colwellia sp. MEBiC06753]